MSIEGKGRPELPSERRAREDSEIADLFRGDLARAQEAAKIVARLRGEVVSETSLVEKGTSDAELRVMVEAQQECGATLEGILAKELLTARGIVRWHVEMAKIREDDLHALRLKLEGEQT